MCLFRSKTFFLGWESDRGNPCSTIIWNQNYMQSNMNESSNGFRPCKPSGFKVRLKTGFSFCQKEGKKSVFTELQKETAMQTKGSFDWVAAYCGISFEQISSSKKETNLKHSFRGSHFPRNEHLCSNLNGPESSHAERPRHCARSTLWDSVLKNCGQSF